MFSGSCFRDSVVYFHVNLTVFAAKHFKFDSRLASLQTGEGKRRHEFAEWHVAWLAEWHNYAECNILRMTQRNKLNSKVRPFLAPINLLKHPLF